VLAEVLICSFLTACTFQVTQTDANTNGMCKYAMLRLFRAETGNSVMLSFEDDIKNTYFLVAKHVMFLACHLRLYCLVPARISMCLV